MIVIRARFFGPEFRRRWRHGLWVLPILTVALTRISLSTALWCFAIVAAFTVVAYALSAAFLAHSSLGIVDGSIRRTSWLRRDRSCPLSSLARVVEVPLVFTPFGYAERWLLFLDPNDRTLMRAYAGYYDPEELVQFARVLDLPWEGFGRPVTPRQARRALPGSFPWPVAHYVLTAVFLLGALYIGSVIVLAIVFALS